MKHYVEHVVIGRRFRKGLSAFLRRHGLLLLLSAPSLLPGQVYQITDLGVLPGQSSSSAVGINQSGQVVGNSGNHAFLYQNGALTDLGFISGSNLTSASAINNKGQIVGTYTLGGNNQVHGFLWGGGILSDPFASLNIGAGDNLFEGIEPVAINDQGQVVADYLQGSYNVTGTFHHGFFLSTLTTPPVFFAIDGHAAGLNNSSQALDVSHPYYNETYIWSASGTTAIGDFRNGTGDSGYAINDAGQVVGEAALSNYNSHAFSWTAGALSDLGTLGGNNSAARAVNNLGQIVGDSELVPNSSSRNAFIYSAGQMLDLNTRLVNPQLWQLQTAVGINDLGQIVGTGTYGGITHGFLLTPQTQGSLYPNHGGNTGKATVLIVSPGFLPSAVQLVGGNTITGTAISVPASLPTAVQVTFDLTGAQPGLYSLVLSQGSGTPVTLSNVFTVDQGGAPDVWLSVAGVAQLRSGLPQTYYVLVGNRGNVDSGTVRIWVTFPSILQWQSAGVQPSSTGQMNGNTYLAFDVSPTLGISLPVPFVLTAPFDSNLAHRPFEIQAWENLQ